jgi:hypothetical protein
VLKPVNAVRAWLATAKITECPTFRPTSRSLRALMASSAERPKLNSQTPAAFLAPTTLHYVSPVSAFILPETVCRAKSIRQSGRVM